MPMNLPEFGGGKVKCGILASSTGRINWVKAKEAGVAFKATVLCSCTSLTLKIACAGVWVIQVKSLQAGVLADGLSQQQSWPPAKLIFTGSTLWQSSNFTCMPIAVIVTTRIKVNWINFWIACICLLKRKTPVIHLPNLLIIYANKFLLPSSYFGWTKLHHSGLRTLQNFILNLYNFMPAIRLTA